LLKLFFLSSWHLRLIIKLQVTISVGFLVHDLRVFPID
jgi:hypothetical protein